VVLFVSAVAPSQAGEVATRCGEYGCDQIHCNYDGNRCVRYSDYDSYYNGYSGYYGGYGEDSDGYGPEYGGYVQNYNGYGPGYDGGYGFYGGYDREHLVCDSDGDRCYQSAEPYWNFREYYRVHGYHWDDGDR